MSRWKLTHKKNARFHFKVELMLITLFRIENYISFTRFSNYLLLNLLLVLYNILNSDQEKGVKIYTSY